jgi:hypothetical protein
MPTPSGQISLDDIYQEPNPGWSSSESFGGIAYNSWALGPLGNNTYGYNGWGGDGSGGGVPIGGNAIYNTGAPLQQGVDFINFANYSNKYYYFDGTVFDIKYSYTNNVPDIPFPPPPINNGVTINVNCYDYTGTYIVHPGFGINAPGGTSSGGAATIPGFSPNTYPLVENVYWNISINTNPGNTISTIAFLVNGATVYTAGSGGGNFTWQSGGATQGNTNGSGIVYDVQIN